MLLYDLLRVKPTASPVEIRKAFLVLAKKVHPDKQTAPDDGSSFLALKKAYDVLSNLTSRDRYDRTGVVDDEDSAGFEAAYERFRHVKVTSEDIAAVETEYRGSSEEKRDLARFFTENKGNVRLALAFILCSREEDVPRFIQVWEEMLKTKEVSAKFRKEFNATKGEIVTDFDEVSVSGEGHEEEEEIDDDDDQVDGFLASDNEEEVEEQDSSLEFSPGTSVQVRHGKKWTEGFVVAARNGMYDLEVGKNKKLLRNVMPSEVRKAESSPKKKLKGVDASLSASILNRNELRQNDLVSKLEAKYSKTKKQTKG